MLWEIIWTDVLKLVQKALRTSHPTGKTHPFVSHIYTRRAPIEIPVAPSPAMARPTMRQSEFGAAAHNMEPTSKMAMDVMKVHLILYLVYSFPNIN